ncbi:MAG: hypothetical protein Q8O33_13520 [Pseudomonadota bacterium]|nr:hypothetical protein [Pseudomonadota bacterium]
MTTGKWIVLVMVMLMSGGAFAGGGKVRGDNGQGSVVQNQIRLAAPESPYVAADSLSVPAEPEDVLPEYDELELEQGEMMP